MSANPVSRDAPAERAPFPIPPSPFPSGRASLLTPPGRGAVAVIAAEGEAALQAIDESFIAANGRTIRRQRPDRIVFGHWTSCDHREEVIVIRGADGGVEVHCHGGLAAAERILTALQSAGCEIESWRERLDRLAASTLEAEADAALAQVATKRAAAILLAQREGALRRAVEAIRHELTANLLEAAKTKLDELLERAPLGLHLTTPWQVAIAGRPNVGKSSLINALVGYQRAIVFDQPGTTRDVLTAETAIDGWPVRLIDAAGIHETDDELEAEGVLRARRQLAEADLVLWVLDGASLAGDPWQAASDEWFVATGESIDASCVLAVVNKLDLLAASVVGSSSADVRFVSALTGQRLPELITAIGIKLVSAVPTDDGIPFTPRQIELLVHARASIAGGQSVDAHDALARL
jgi:tRNA modification GTPase